MKNIQEVVRKIAITEACVLITGESGTGKEVIANHIHNLSTRSQHAFIQINCGAIPESLMEAELFGYEKGAFTGAETKKAGLLELADKGTILLDEIGELPLHLQVKLLRVIQTKEIRRVGGTSSKKLDIRFIAATNRNLEEMVSAGQFREDLFYRINVVPLTIPPLRERKEDILPLARHFLKAFNQKYNRLICFTEETCKTLKQYTWPGNVRQLENIIERMVIMSDGDYIEADMLPKEIYKSSTQISIEMIVPLKKQVEEAERQIITFSLSKSKSIRQAAKQLEIDHTTLLRKMNKLGIQIPKEGKDY